MKNIITKKGNNDISEGVFTIMDEKKELLIKKLQEHSYILIGVLIGIVIINFNIFSNVIYNLKIYEFIIMLIFVSILFVLHIIYRSTGNA